MNVKSKGGRGLNIGLDDSGRRRLAPLPGDANKC